MTIIGPDGEPIRSDEGDPETEVESLVQSPAKVMRIGSMIKQLLDEVKSAPLDESARVRLREIHLQSIKELEDALAPELVEELERLSQPFNDPAPSEAELRIAQAQLVGWLEGLFHGIQLWVNLPRADKMMAPGALAETSAAVIELGTISE